MKKRRFLKLLSLTSLVPLPRISSRAEEPEQDFGDCDDITMLSLTSMHERKWNDCVVAATLIHEDHPNTFCWLYNGDEDITWPFIPKKILFENKDKWGADLEVKLYWEDGRSNTRRITLKPGEQKLVDCSYRQLVAFQPINGSLAMIAASMCMFLMGCKTTQTPSADLFPPESYHMGCAGD